MDQVLVGQPRLVVLDTAHFAGLVADILSGDVQKKRAALNFVPELLARGWLPLICFHHIEELLQHRDEKLVDARMRYLWSLPMASWIRASDPEAGPGSILDVLRTEAVAALGSPGADVLRVRDLAADELIAVGSGVDAIPDCFRAWRLLRDALSEHQQNNRRVAAIARWRATEIDDKSLAELMGQRIRTRPEAVSVLNRLRNDLKEEIETRGDKRIGNPAAMAADFMQEVAAKADHLQTEGCQDDPVIQVLLSSGLDRDDIDMSATFRETMDLLCFQDRLRLAMRDFHVPWSEIRSRVTRKQLPVTTIEEAMRRHSQDLPERKGSELNDTRFLCLAPYADMTFVDKRTLENFRRAASKDEKLGCLLGGVARAKDYAEVAAMLFRL